jgi:hypothetical protein
MKKLFVFLIISCTLQGCAVYDWIYTPTVNKSLNKQNFSWVSDTVEGIAYHFDKGSYKQEDMHEIKDVTKRSISKILVLTDEKEYPETIDYFIVPTRERMKELTGFTINAFAYPRLNVVYAIIGSKIRAIGGHEFNHTITANIWGNAESWLSEGFAVYSDDGWNGYSLYELNNYLLGKNKLLSLEELIDKFHSHSVMVTYPQSGGIVKYLYEKYGIEKFKTLWQKGSGSIEKIYGKRLTEIEKEWKEEIKKHDLKGINY